MGLGRCGWGLSGLMRSRSVLCSQPEWARVLADECRELRDSNVLLRNEVGRARPPSGCGH